jgi:hypothetical protein
METLKKNKQQQTAPSPFQPQTPLFCISEAEAKPTKLNKNHFLGTDIMYQIRMVRLFCF